jgi:hypothetical protein
VCEFCDPVTEATATINPSCTSATITWSAVVEAKKYEISRDGILLGTVTTPEYTEAFNFQNDTIYTWEIKTICDISESIEVSVSAICELCNPVTDLTASPPVGECTSILLSWNAAENMPDATYNIYKDEIKIAGNIANTEYVDTDIELDVEYIWTVKTICANGESTGVDVEGGCKTGINDISTGLLSVQVYPNPTRGELRVESGELRVENVEVFDVFGKIILHSPFSILHSYDLTVLPPGIYFVRIQTENDVIVRKVIKN